MPSIRVLVGTRKGAFILTSDSERKTWHVAGPHFAGWEVYHLKGSPTDPNRLYAAVHTAWHGQVVQSSSDGGETWTVVGNKLAYAGETGTHLWYDDTPHPWEFKRIWHLEPTLHDADTVYAGVEDAALFLSKDGAQTWTELPALREHRSGLTWTPGAGGLCLHTIVVDPTNPDRIFIAISAAGAFRTDDAGDNWRKISGDLPTDFGFVIDVHAHEPETIYVVPIKSDSQHFPLDGALKVFRSRTGGDTWEPLTDGLPQENCYVNVLRDAMAVDTLPSCGIYFGTTGGQVYVSPDAGDHWQAITEHLPPVLSVEVQTLA